MECPTYFFANAALGFCEIGGANARDFSDRIVEKALERFRLTWLYLKWLAGEGREVLDGFDSGRPSGTGPERAGWLCLEALLWPERRKSDAETEKFVEYWSTAGVGEIRSIGLSITDDVDKCSLVDHLYRVKQYWSNAGIELDNLDATAVAISQTLPDNGVIKPMKTAWQALAPPQD